MNALLLALAIAIDHNVGLAAMPQFTFKNVPAPARNDAATKATLTLLAGTLDGGSAELNALTDGALPTDEDQPVRNVFFKAATWGGRVRLDLVSAIDIAQINTYSWHSDSRAPQLYKVFAGDETDPNFNPAPSSKLDPAMCGWKLIAFIDTRPKDEDDWGGQFAVSIRDSNGTVGKYRYVLFDFFETESDDPWGNTFYSEIDVIGR
ncbi:MAG TPA: hypothetical protein VKL19_07805 [Thermoanaerobaculia bacterium]|nr:hypothetical protein [Thermoanaerobaculia bacterium]